MEKSENLYQIFYKKSKATKKNKRHVNIEPEKETIDKLTKFSLLQLKHEPLMTQQS